MASDEQKAALGKKNTKEKFVVFILSAQNIGFFYFFEIRNIIRKIKNCFAHVM